MYHVSAQGVDERIINVHYYYSLTSAVLLSEVGKSPHVAQAHSVTDHHEDVLKLGVPGRTDYSVFRDLAALRSAIVQRGRQLGVRFQLRVARFHHDGPFHAVSRCCLYSICTDFTLFHVVACIVYAQIVRRFTLLPV